MSTPSTPASLARARALTEQGVPASTDLRELDRRLMDEAQIGFHALHVILMRPERAAPLRDTFRSIREAAEAASWAERVEGFLTEEGSRTAASHVARILAWLDAEVFGRVEARRSELGYVPPGDLYRAATLIQTAATACRSLVRTGDPHAMGREELDLVDEEIEVRRARRR